MENISNQENINLGINSDMDKLDQKLIRPQFKKRKIQILTVVSICLVIVIVIINIFVQAKPVTHINTIESKNQIDTENSVLPNININELESHYLLIDSKNNLILVSADGKQSKPLFPTTKKIGFAGYFENTRTIYYTNLRENKVIVYSYSIQKNIKDEVLTFETSEKINERFLSTVKVSPNQKYIAYSNKKGDLLIFDIKNKKSRTLIKSNSTCHDPHNCYGFYDPVWSPDGQYILVSKLLYEGARQILIDPFTINSKVIELAPGGIPIWSPDGNRIAQLGNGYGAGGLYLSNSNTNTNTQAIFETNNALRESTVNGALWLDSDKIAFGYSNAQKNGIGIYDSKTQITKILLSTKYSPNGLPYTVYNCCQNNNEIFYSDEVGGFWKINWETTKKDRLAIPVNKIIEILRTPVSSL